MAAESQKKFHSKIIDKKDYNKHMKDYFDVDHWSRMKNKQNRKKVMQQIEDNDVRNSLINISRTSICDFHQNPSSNMDKLFDKLDRLNNLNFEEF